MLGLRGRMRITWRRWRGCLMPRRRLVSFFSYSYPCWIRINGSLQTKSPAKSMTRACAMPTRRRLASSCARVMRPSSLRFMCADLHSRTCRCCWISLSRGEVSGCLLEGLLQMVSQRMSVADGGFVMDCWKKSSSTTESWVLMCSWMDGSGGVGWMTMMARCDAR